MRTALLSPRPAAPVALMTSALLAGCGGGAPTRTRDAQADATADVQSIEHDDPRAAICASADAAGLTAAPPFDLIQQIFDGNCTSCHSPGADVDLSPGVAWGDLVGRPAPATEACGGTLVVPGSPDPSYLYQKLSLDQPCSGARMPRTEFASDPLPDCVVALVRNWIASGAPGPGQDGGDG
jgi:hypothetical protein